MYEIKVEGMTCGGCVNSVTRALAANDPKAKVSVDLMSQIIRVETTQTQSEITSIVEDAGYSVLQFDRAS